MGWDLHRNIFDQMISFHGPVFDRAMSALLDDLDERGLLDETLVVAFGEMGRSPKMGGSGRNHWPSGSTFWAGGGVKRGAVIGETTEDAGEPKTKPLTAKNINATICHAAGISTIEMAQMGVLPGSEVFHELFA